MTDRIQIDLDSLTIGEMEQVEDLAGMPITFLSDPNKPKAKLMRALVFVTQKRTNPTFTWEDAGKLGIDVFNGSGADPIDAAG